MTCDGCNQCAQVFRRYPITVSKDKVNARWQAVGESGDRHYWKAAKVAQWERIYMLIVMDHFSKWTQTYPLSGHKSPTVAKVLAEQLVKQLFSRLSIPYQLRSDHGPGFGSELFLQMCKWMDIDQIRTNPYRPACNDIRERYQRTLNTLCWEKSSK